MVSKNIKYPDQELFDFVMNELKKRNINSHTVGEAAYQLQHQYLPELTIADFGYQLNEILKKREVLNTLALGFEIDNLATEKKLSEPLQTIIENDLGIFGLDELLAMNISQLYGSLSVSNFGFADKIKVGIAKDLDTDESHVQTFSDDLFSALVSAVIGRCGNGAKLELKKSDKGDTNFQESNPLVADDRYNIAHWLSAPVTTFNGIPIEDYKIFKEFVLNNYTYLSNDLEELFNHDYFIDIIESEDDTLFLTFNDNSMSIEQTATISLKKLYHYILSKLTVDFHHSDMHAFPTLVYNFLTEEKRMLPANKSKKIEDLAITDESISKFLDEINPFLEKLLQHLGEDNNEQQ